MKTKEWLVAATKQLTAAGIGTARLDALLLLEDILEQDRSAILAYPEHTLTVIQQKKLENQLMRRLTHEPLAYIRGKVEFYGRSFMVDKRVLQPRPETETMVQLALDLTLPTKSVIADIGTGSGCIALTLKLEQPDLKVLATDSDAGCLAVARHNAKQLQADVSFYKGNLLTPLKDQAIDVIMANLPYVPANFTINEAALQEPKEAIFGGTDGLDLYRELFTQLNKRSQKPKYVLTESMPPQHDKLTNIAKDHGYTRNKTDDFIQLFELVTG
jgi:release factor glutamine methyltransferase